MAKHKSSKQSSSYCPIVSDLIDLGAALALDVFSALLRQRESASKHSYRVDPYAAAGIAAGIYKDANEAVADCVAIRRVFEPNAENHAYYMEMYDKYRKVYDFMRSIECKAQA